ncbi:MAG: TolC family protein [Acidobacteria bacterium]|nr:TolC family protein [Acidobacteriota bacterium]
MSQSARFLISAGIVLASVLPALAQPKAADPSPDHVKTLIAQAMQQTGQKPPTTGMIEPPAGPTVNLTEQEAVARAQQGNLTLISERITPQTWDYSMSATRAFYLPTLTSTVGSINQTDLNTSAFSGGVKTTSETQSWSGGITKQMWRGGGSYSAQWTNSRNETSSTFSTCNPCFSSGLQGLFTQPLLRNRKIDNTRATILTNEINQDIAELNLNAQEVSILAQVRNAYWELVYARQAVEAAQQSLELASKLVGDNRARVEIGTMAPIDIIQAQAEEANRRQQLVTAQATQRNNELGLKRLIVRGTDDELWRATIIPVDHPTVTAQAVDLEGAVRAALSRRTDLAVSRRNLDAVDITLQSLDNQTKPGLDLIGQLNLAGRAGVGVARLDPTTGLSVAPPAGGYFDTIGQLGSFEAPTWNVRLQFNYPLGTTSAKANVSRQRLLRRQQEATLKATELQIATEVTGAALAVRNSFEAMQAAQVSRELSEQRLNAAQAKFEQGMATNYEVVQAQRDLNDARNSELRQQLNYQRALVDFQRVQITR